MVAAIETINRSKLTLDFVKARLLDVHNKRRYHNQALAFGTKKQNFPYKCHNCGKVGHKCDEYRSRPKVIRNQHNCGPANKNRTHFLQSTNSRSHKMKIKVKLLSL